MSKEQPPAWVLAAWPDGIPTASRATWGFDHETWLLSRDGQTLVVQRRSGRSDPTGRDRRRLRAAVRRTGIQVPEPALVRRDAGRVVLALPLVEGRPGSELLADQASAEAVGRMCGSTAASLSRIDPAGLGLPRTWASGDRLVAAGRRWVQRCGARLDPRTSALLTGLLDAGARETGEVSPSVAHGDLAPVNILVRDGTLAALLDLDRARLAHPLFDAAWFSWVVTYHHPEVAGAAWRGFASASRLPRQQPAAFGWLQPLQVLERAATAPRMSERAMWIDRLASLLAAPQPR